MYCKCFCSRCTAEWEDCASADSQELERKHGEDSVIRFNSDLETVAVDFSFPPNLPMNGSFTFSDWEDIPWKRACVLNHQFDLLSRKVNYFTMQVDMTPFSLQSALKYRFGMISLEEAGAILCLTQLLEQKQTYLSKTSFILVPYYRALERLIGLFLSVGVTSSVTGFQTEEQLSSQKMDLRNLLKSAEAHSTYEHHRSS